MKKLKQRKRESSAPYRKATLKGKFWKNFLGSFRHCFKCGHSLQRRYVKEEKSRRLVCRRCGQITYLNPKIVAGLIPLLPDGRIVLLRRAIEPAKGKWTYPAGFQELGETVETAAARETLEEICSRVKITKFIGVYAYADAGVVTIVYEGRFLSKNKPCAGEEAQEVAFFKPSQIPWKELAFRSTVQSLKDWKKLNR